MSDSEKLISAIIQKGDTKFLMDHPELKEYLAHSQLDASLFALIDNHVKKHGKLPKLQTVEHEWGQKLAEAIEPPSYYLEPVRNMHIRRTLQGATMEAQPFMKENPEKALEIVEKACMTMRMQRAGLAAIDLREATQAVMAHLASKTAGESITFGWQTLDNMSGGLQRGDFDVLAGRRGLGKTYALLSRAFHFWNLGKRVVFLSNEMMLPQILEHAAAIQGEIPANYMKQGILPNVVGIDFQKKLLNALNAAKTAQQGFWFFDGNLVATHEDVYRIVMQLEPHVVCADAAYLMAGSNYSDRWQRIAESATFLKLGICPKCPVVATYQFTAKSLKESKKKGSGDPDDLDVAGSQEIGNLASVMLGMYQSENPEAINRRRIGVIKGRYGEVGEFEIEWDFHKMAFGEIIDDGSLNIT